MAEPSGARIGEPDMPRSSGSAAFSIHSVLGLKPRVMTRPANHRRQGQQRAVTLRLGEARNHHSLRQDARPVGQPSNDQRRHRAHEAVIDLRLRGPCLWIWGAEHGDVSAQVYENAFRPHVLARAEWGKQPRVDSIFVERRGVRRRQARQATRRRRDIALDAGFKDEAAALTNGHYGLKRCIHARTLHRPHQCVVARRPGVRCPGLSATYLAALAEHDRCLCRLSKLHIAARVRRQLSIPQSHARWKFRAERNLEMCCPSERRPNAAPEGDAAGQPGPVGGAFSSAHIHHPTKCGPSKPRITANGSGDRRSLVRHPPGCDDWPEFIGGRMTAVGWLYSHNQDDGDLPDRGACVVYRLSDGFETAARDWRAAGIGRYEQVAIVTYRVVQRISEGVLDEFGRQELREWQARFEASLADDDRVG